MKHDAHVRTAFMHFFPFKFWCFTIFASLLLGIFFGYEFGMVQRILLLD